MLILLELNGYSRIKLDEEGKIIKSKARFVAQGYSQVEGLNFNVTFVLVTCLESIRLFMAIACSLKFKLYQMNIKIVFLNGYLNEKV